MSSNDATRFGRIDVHSHLLPDMDDGCPTTEESLKCIRRLIGAGYTHSFCTPHVWPNLPHNTVEGIVAKTEQLQRDIDAAGLKYTVISGGEFECAARLSAVVARSSSHLRDGTEVLPLRRLGRRDSEVFLDVGRMAAIAGIESDPRASGANGPVQDDPDLAEQFQQAGLLLQGNLQCFGDPPSSHTRRVAERYLREGRYFLLGSDTHNVLGLDIRLAGLENAINLVGDAEIWRLTRDNPMKLIG